jgi:two-component system, NtrC family, response regulator HydG
MSNDIKKTVVVVDDDFEIHDLISAFFRPRGFEVICFDSASVALAESAASGKSWDVLLTDYHFPNMLAADFSKEISSRFPHLPVILITPLELAETAIKAIESGAYDFISRPLHFGQLQVAVDRALKAKSLANENLGLRELVKSTKKNSSTLIGRSHKFLAAIDIAERVSKSAASILISGESGTGKEVFAKFIHANSKHGKGPFTAINCSSIPENLLESELFGHAKGSFTGAIEKRIGLFEAAEDGTLFLDEIGDLSLVLQAKLLRVLQEKKIKRVGENQDRDINCRIISATHKNLSLEIQEGRFREDLFFRLNVIPIFIPPLRERPEDLMPLAESFLKRMALENDSKARIFSKDSIKFILEHKWPGNVRELENTVERAVILCSGSEILLEDFVPLIASESKAEAQQAAPPSLDSDTFSFHHLDKLPSLDEVINKYISYAIVKNGGARDKAAKDIGIDRKTLYRRMQAEAANQLQ